MASLEAKLATALTEVQNLRIALSKEVEERRRDHDLIIQQREQLKTVFNLLEEIKHERRQAGARVWQVWLAVLSSVLALALAASQRILGGKP